MSKKNSNNIKKSTVSSGNKFSDDSVINEMDVLPSTKSIKIPIKFNVDFDPLIGYVNSEVTLAMSPDSTGLFTIGNNVDKYTGISKEETKEAVESGMETPDDAVIYGMCNVMNNGDDIFFWTNGTRLAGAADKVGVLSGINELLTHECLHLTRTILNKHILKNKGIVKWAESDWLSIGDQDDDIKEESFATALGLIAEQVTPKFIEMASEYIPELKNSTLPKAKEGFHIYHDLFQKGGRKTKNGITILNPIEEATYQDWRKSLPSNLQNDTSGYDLRGAWATGIQPELFYYDEQGKFQSAHPIDVNEPGSIYQPHLFSIDPDTGRYLKSPTHDTYLHAIEGDIKAGYTPYMNVKTGHMYVKPSKKKQGGNVIHESQVLPIAQVGLNNNKYNEKIKQYLSQRNENLNQSIFDVRSPNEYGFRFGNNFNVQSGLSFDPMTGVSSGYGRFNLNKKGFDLGVEKRRGLSENSFNVNTGYGGKNFSTNLNYKKDKNLGNQFGVSANYFNPKGFNAGLNYNYNGTSNVAGNIGYNTDDYGINVMGNYSPNEQQIIANLNYKLGQRKKQKTTPIKLGIEDAKETDKTINESVILPRAQKGYNLLFDDSINRLIENTNAGTLTTPEVVIYASDYDKKFQNALKNKNNKNNQNINKVKKIENWLGNVATETLFDQIPYFNIPKAAYEFLGKGKPFTALSELVKLPGSFESDAVINMLQDNPSNYSIGKFEENVLPEMTFGIENKDLLKKIGFEIIKNKNLPGLSESSSKFSKLYNVPKKEITDFIKQNMSVHKRSYEQALGDLEKKLKYKKELNNKLSSKNSYVNKQHGGIIHKASVINAQKGKNITIDGKKYKINSPEYRKLYYDDSIASVDQEGVPTFYKDESIWDDYLEEQRKNKVANAVRQGTGKFARGVMSGANYAGEVMGTPVALALEALSGRRDFQSALPNIDRSNKMFGLPYSKENLPSNEQLSPSSALGITNPYLSIPIDLAADYATGKILSNPKKYVKAIKPVPFDSPNYVYNTDINTPAQRYQTYRWSEKNPETNWYDVYEKEFPIDLIPTRDPISDPYQKIKMKSILRRDEGVMWPIIDYLRTKKLLPRGNWNISDVLSDPITGLLQDGNTRYWLNKRYDPTSGLNGNKYKIENRISNLRKNNFEDLKPLYSTDEPIKSTWIDNKQIGGIIHESSVIKAQKGKNITIDGKVYNTSSPEYKKLYYDNSVASIDKEGLPNMYYPEIEVTAKAPDWLKEKRRIEEIIKNGPYSFKTSNATFPTVSKIQNSEPSNIFYTNPSKAWAQVRPTGVNFDINTLEGKKNEEVFRAKETMDAIKNSKEYKNTLKNAIELSKFILDEDEKYGISNYFTIEGTDEYNAGAIDDNFLKKNKQSLYDYQFNNPYGLYFELEKQRNFPIDYNIIELLSKKEVEENPNRYGYMWSSKEKEYNKNRHPKYGYHKGIKMRSDLNMDENVATAVEEMEHYQQFRPSKFQMRPYDSPYKNDPGWISNITPFENEVVKKYNTSSDPYLLSPVETAAKKRAAEVYFINNGMLKPGEKMGQKHYEYLEKEWLKDVDEKSHVPMNVLQFYLLSIPNLKDHNKHYDEYFEDAKKEGLPLELNYRIINDPKNNSKAIQNFRKKQANNFIMLSKLLAQNNKQSNSIKTAKSGGTVINESDVIKYKSGGNHGGLDRWFAEKWVDVKTGKECGRQEGEKRKSYPACRPSVRVTSKTPKTASELSSAEKEKFKRSKTSSQRINYQHKRNK